MKVSQQSFICCKSTLEILEKSVKYAQSEQQIHHDDFSFPKNSSSPKNVELKENNSVPFASVLQKLFFKISKNSQEKYCAGASF